MLKEPKVYKACKGSMALMLLKVYQEVKAPKACRDYKACRAYQTKASKDLQAPRVQEPQEGLTHKYNTTTGEYLEEYRYYYTTMLQEN